MSVAGDRLEQARIRAGYKTAADAARALKLPYPTYAGHENGERGYARSAARYARFFKCNLVWLLTGQGRIDLGPVENELSDLEPEEAAEVLRFRDYLKQRRQTG